MLLVAASIILVVGFIDDTRSLGPRMKLLGQALAVLALYVGGIRIHAIDVLFFRLDLGFPSIELGLLGYSAQVAVPSLLVTMLWFLGCMNVWNLIDGMDGLASGVGLLVSGTLTLVAIHNENFEVAVLAVALAGGLAGFLLYNWHPACIFLGDSGSLLIGLLIGVIGVQGSMEGPSAISILFPILAMGLPISDTAMAIFRRWVRNLPLSAADRRHVHHLLIGLGLNQRQAALLLYCFSGFLCGVVMLGVALRNEYLPLVLGILGCLVFLLVVTSRRDELANLRDDLQDRLTRGRQERQAAKLAWEAIQRIELCGTAHAAYDVVDETARALGCACVSISADGAGRRPSPWRRISALPGEFDQLVSGPSAIFRLSGGPERWITVGLGMPAASPLAADIIFRYLHRLCQALAERLKWLESASSEADGSSSDSSAIPECGPDGGSPRSHAPLSWGAQRAPARQDERRASFWHCNRALAAQRRPPAGQPGSRCERMIHRRNTEAFMYRTQGYKENSALASVRRSQIVALPAQDLAALKSPANYFQALRRRAWMVLAVTAPLAIVASMVVLKLPPVYLARAEIEINPPEIDQVLSALVNHDIGRRDPTNAANYVPNGEARLRSKGLHERVVADEAIAPDAAQYIDPAFEMFKSLSVQRVKTTSLFIVSLEGKDPVKTKKLLETLLLEFKKQATRENEDKLEATEVYAKQDIEKLKKSQKELDERAPGGTRQEPHDRPGGRSFLEEQYLSHTALMTQHQMQLAQVHQQLLVAQLFPKLDYDPAASARAMKIEQLEREAKKYTRVLERQKRGMRGNVFNNDLVVREVATYLDELLDEIEALRSAKSALPQAPTDLILNQYQSELDADKEVHEELLAKMQAGIPEHQRILGLLHDREEKAKQCTRMEEKLGDFGILKQSLVNSDCVRIPASVAEPTMPIKPNRPVLIALGIAASLALGIGIVCLLEHIDHSVKVPEHVTHGLVLPLLGVVPRIRRTALSQRGRPPLDLGQPRLARSRCLPQRASQPAGNRR